MNRRVIFLAHLSFLVFIQGGCAQPLYWAKPNAQPGEFEREVRECQEHLSMEEGSTGAFNFHSFSASIGTDSVALEQCLAEKGWFLARKPND